MSGYGFGANVISKTIGRLTVNSQRTASLTENSKLTELYLTDSSVDFSLVCKMVSSALALRVYKLGQLLFSPVNRFGLAVRRQADKQRDLGSNLLRLSFRLKSCGQWTLSCDFVHHN